MHEESACLFIDWAIWHDTMLPVLEHPQPGLPLDAISAHEYKHQQMKLMMLKLTQFILCFMLEQQ